MSELTFSEMGSLGITKEVIQIGAVILDEEYHFLSDFETFVKPNHSHITENIFNLTGISEENLKDAPDFVCAFSNYIKWIESKIGNEKFMTYCWSNMDYEQLKSEIYLKAKDNEEFLSNINTIVDLQRTFSEVLGTKCAIGLDTAINFCHENFEGKAHTAKADAFNTAVILNKLCKAKYFYPQFHIIHESILEKLEEEKKEEEKFEKSMSSSFASFLKPELLEKFGYKKELQEYQENEKIKETSTDYSNYVPAKMSKREKKLLKLQQKEENRRKKLSPEIQRQIANSHPSLKYHISPPDWIHFYTRMIFFKANINV